MARLKTIVKRGQLIESLHEVKCLVKDSNYKTLISTKHNKDLIYPRSSIKIFQALPFILSKAIDKYNLDEKMIALSCSSHCGEPRHLIILSKWVKKIGLSIKNLKCGSHNPLNHKSSNNLLLSGQLPNELHNNCSGKHLGMLSGCLAYDMPFHNYNDYNHPYQKLIRDALEYFMETSIKDKHVGIDGCNVPQYAFSLESLANSMVKIFQNKQKNNDYSTSIEVLINAIKKNPELIGGKNRFDSEVIKHTNGRIFCKGGAEGLLLFSDFKKKIGGVLKIVDGNYRAIPSTAIKIFYELKLIHKDEKKYLNKWIKQKIYNHAKKEIGEIFSTIE